jgi:ABC-type transporter Mla subunit MlaD
MEKTTNEEELRRTMMQLIERVIALSNQIDATNTQVGALSQNMDTIAGVTDGIAEQLQKLHQQSNQSAVVQVTTAHSLIVFAIVIAISALGSLLAQLVYLVRWG